MKRFLTPLLAAAITALLLGGLAWSQGVGPTIVHWGVGSSGGGGLGSIDGLMNCAEGSANDITCELSPTATIDADDTVITPADLAGPQSITFRCNGATINRASGAQAAFRLDAQDAGLTNSDENADYQWYKFEDCIWTADDQGADGDITAVADNGAGLVRVTTSAAHGLVDWGTPDAYVGVYDIGYANSVTYDGIWPVAIIDATHVDLLGSTWDAAHVASTGQWAEQLALVVTDDWACSGAQNDCDNKVSFENCAFDNAGSLEGSSAVQAGTFWFPAEDRNKNLDVAFYFNKGRISNLVDMYVGTTRTVGSATFIGNEIEGFRGPQWCAAWIGGLVSGEFPHKGIYVDPSNKWKWCGGMHLATIFKLDVNFHGIGIGGLNPRSPLLVYGQYLDLEVNVGGEAVIPDERWRQTGVAMITIDNTGSGTSPAIVDIDWRDSVTCVGIGANSATPFIDVLDPADGAVGGLIWEVDQVYPNDGFGCTRTVPFSAALLADWATQTDKPTGYYREYSTAWNLDVQYIVEGALQRYIHETCFHRADPATDEEYYSVWRVSEPTTIAAIWCETDAGTVAMDLEIDDGTPTGVNGSDLSCAVSPGTEDTSLGGDTELFPGEELDVDLGAVAGGATELSVCWKHYPSVRLD
jgi:hypothetical protein